MPKQSSNIIRDGDTANLEAGKPEENTQASGVSEVYEPVSYSPLHVEGDPKYHYYWASTRNSHPQNVQVMKRMGYEVVPENSGEFTPFAENREGGRVVDDLILMRIPQERAEQIRLKRAEMFRQRLSQYEEEMTAFAENVDGVTVMTEPSERTSFYFPNNPLAKR